MAEEEKNIRGKDDKAKENFRTLQEDELQTDKCRVNERTDEPQEPKCVGAALATAATTTIGTESIRSDGEERTGKQCQRLARNSNENNFRAVGDGLGNTYETLTVSITYTNIDSTKETTKRNRGKQSMPLPDVWT